jgi:hypothetical protein
VTICPECGKAFDGDQCWVCVTRRADIEETFSLSLPVALAGIIGTIIAFGTYPPLESNSLVDYSIPALFIIPGAIVLVLELSWRLARYALFVRLMFVLVAATFVMTASYYFLNGLLDGSTPVEAKAVVSEKYINHGRGSTYNLVWTLSWNQKNNIKGSMGVRRETFSAAEPGDSVRVMIHPGEFSQAWYSDVHLWGSRVRN